MAPSSLMQRVALALTVCLSCTAAIPPGVLPFLGRQNEVPQDEVLDCSPSPDGSPLPVGCQEKTQLITYGNPGDESVLEVVEGDEDVTVVEDEHAGTFVIRVPKQQLYKSKKCFFRHIYVAELDMCVLPRYRYQPGAFKYPGLTAYFRR